MLICINLQLFAGWSSGNINDNHGNHYHFNAYRSNDLIEYDQYKQQQAGAKALGRLIGYAIGLGIQKAAVSHRDNVIGQIMKDYKTTKHNKYMATLADSTAIKEKHKKYLILLFNDYKKYRDVLDDDYLNFIHKVKKPKIIYWELDLDLSETPYISNSKIENWVIKNYTNIHDQEYVLEKIYEYKNNRLLADKELNNIYFAILKS